jgi:hypothetical protein
VTSPDGPQEPRPAGPPPEFPLVAWAKAIVFGIGDTARDMLDEGRRGAREAYDERWQRFDAKTRHRRDRKR